MRPAGEVHLALLQAAHAIRAERASTGQGATLLELVHRSQVGYKVARALVPKLSARGQLTKVGERKVPYRNRPVAEYVPTDMVEASTEPVIGAGWVNLGDALQHWKG
jgi:hypothetical protein